MGNSHMVMVNHKDMDNPVDMVHLSLVFQEAMEHRLAAM